MTSKHRCYGGILRLKITKSFQVCNLAGRVSGPMRFGLCKPMILTMEVASLLPPDGRTEWGELLRNDSE